MDIQSLSTEWATQKVMEQAGNAVLGMAMDQAQLQSQGLAKLMDSAASAVQISDPALGRKVNLLA